VGETVGGGRVAGEEARRRSEGSHLGGGCWLTASGYNWTQTHAGLRVLVDEVFQGGVERDALSGLAPHGAQTQPRHASWMWARTLR
jgi:hypothetical protein